MLLKVTDVKLNWVNISGGGCIAFVNFHFEYMNLNVSSVCTFYYFRGADIKSLMDPSPKKPYVN